MKKIILYPLLAFILLITSSCEFLDKEPDDELTLEMVFNDKTRTEDWLAGVYNGIPDPYYPMMKNLDMLADDFTPSAGWEAYGWDCIGKIQGNWNSESTWAPNLFEVLPKKIRSAYIFIDNVRANQDQGVTEEEVVYMKAECKFLIAYYYSLLLNYYGSIPFQARLADIEEPIENLQIGQTPYDQVVDWIDKELQGASKILPSTYDDAKKYGRATSIMCLAVRARMLLFSASPLVNGNQDYAEYVNDKGVNIFNTQVDASKWVRAAKAYDELLAEAHGAGHKLYNELNADGTIDPFLSYQNMSLKRYDEGNKEILFARPSSQVGMYDRHAQPRSVGGNGGLGVTQTLVDAFFMKNGFPPILGYNDNGSPILNDVSKTGYSEKGFSTSDESRKTKWIESQGVATKTNNPVTLKGTYNMYCNREPRFYVSVVYNGAWFRLGEKKTDFYKDGADGGPTHDAPQNGYLVRKRVHPNYDPKQEINVYRPGILYRLGEAYLSYAEALNESSPGNPDILLYVNQVRERAGIPTYGAGVGQIPIPSDMREAIKRERRVEMNCEFSVRFDDIRRWKEGAILNGAFYGMNKEGTESGSFFQRTKYITRVFSDKNYWFPLHQNQIDKNLNLRQLPGW